MGKFLKQFSLGGKIQNGVPSFCPREPEIRLEPLNTLGRLHVFATVMLLTTLDDIFILSSSFTDLKVSLLAGVGP